MALRATVKPGITALGLVVGFLLLGVMPPAIAAPKDPTPPAKSEGKSEDKDGDEKKTTTSEGLPKSPTPSLEEEPKLDPDLVELEEHFGVLTKGPLVEQVARVKSRLLRGLPRKQAERIVAVRVLDSEMENAFAVPDGHIYFFRGLLETMDSDDQVAGVMAHEFTHVFEEHSKQVGKDAWKYQLGGLLAAMLSGQPELYVIGQVAGTEMMLHYSQKAEKEADLKGLGLMVAGGYDPVGMLEFMSHMDEETKRSPLLMQGYFLSHPYPVERMAAIKEWMAGKGYLVPAQLYKSRLPVGVVETPIEGGSPTIALTLGGADIFAFGGTTEDAKSRAYAAAEALSEALEEGMLDYDFRIDESSEGPRIAAHAREILVVTAEDAAIAEKAPSEVAGEALRKLKGILWKKRVEARI